MLFLYTIEQDVNITLNLLKENNLNIHNILDNFNNIYKKIDIEKKNNPNYQIIDQDIIDNINSIITLIFHTNILNKENINYFLSCIVLIFSSLSQNKVNKNIQNNAINLLIKKVLKIYDNSVVSNIRKDTSGNLYYYIINFMTNNLQEDYIIKENYINIQCYSYVLDLIKYSFEENNINIDNINIFINKVFEEKVYDSLDKSNYLNILKNIVFILNLHKKIQFDIIKFIDLAFKFNMLFIEKSQYLDFINELIKIKNIITKDKKEYIDNNIKFLLFSKINKIIGEKLSLIDNKYVFKGDFQEFNQLLQQLTQMSQYFQTDKIKDQKIIDNIFNFLNIPFDNNNIFNFLNSENLETLNTLEILKINFISIIDCLDLNNNKNINNNIINDLNKMIINLQEKLPKKNDLYKNLTNSIIESNENNNINKLSFFNKFNTHKKTNLEEKNINKQPNQIIQYALFFTSIFSTFVIIKLVKKFIKNINNKNIF